MSVLPGWSGPTLWDLAEIVQEETERVFQEHTLVKSISTEVLIRFIQGHVSNMTVVESSPEGELSGV